MTSSLDASIFDFGSVELQDGTLEQVWNWQERACVIFKFICQNTDALIITEATNAYITDSLEQVYSVR